MTAEQPRGPQHASWVLDQTHGQERIGWVKKADGPGGFLTILWHTNRTTEVRTNSVYDMAVSRSMRGYVWSDDTDAVRARVFEVVAWGPRSRAVHKFIDRMEQMP